MTHTKEEVISRLEEGIVGILGTLDKTDNSIRTRVMYYGIEENGTFYLMSTKGSPKLDQILTTDSISFIVYSLEDPFDNSWEIELNGTARLLQESEEINRALKKLEGRNPFADVAIESGITRQFDFIELNPGIVRFRIYSEALEGVEPSIFEFSKEIE